MPTIIIEPIHHFFFSFLTSSKRLVIFVWVLGGLVFFEIYTLPLTYLSSVCNNENLITGDHLEYQS